MLFLILGSLCLLDNGAFAQRGANCVSCTNCAVCAERSFYSVGTFRVDINLSGCKGGSAISWACCKGSTTNALNDGFCNLYNCDAELSNWDLDKEKCDETSTISFLVPSSATSITLQLHDGNFLGNIEPSFCSQSPGACCGGTSGACSNAPSGACQIMIDILESCPTRRECDTDSDCHRFDDTCATGRCNVESGVCSQELRPEGAVCRPALDLCDVPETCTGHSAECPTDLRNDHGYTYKCGLDQYLCAVEPSDLTMNGNAYRLGSCGIGTAGRFIQLPWPACVSQCIHNICPNNKYLSNFALAKCNVNSGYWDCTMKQNVDPLNFITTCPYQ